VVETDMSDVGLNVQREVASGESLHCSCMEG
jgi:hypothetical protein